MGRIFTFLSVIAVIMVLLASGGVYWLLTTDIEQSQKNSIASLAKGVAISISAQIDLLNLTLEKMAQDPALIVSIEKGDPVQLKKVTSHFANYLPGAMKLRLVLPGTTTPDLTEVPHMGYADLEIVRETLTANKPPMIQGDKGPNRHMAIAHRVVHNDRTIGVLLASIDYNLVSHSSLMSITKSGSILKSCM